MPKTAKDGSKAGAAARMDWNRITDWATLAGWGFGLAGIAVALGVWVPKLVERVGSEPLRAPVRVRFADEPAWLPRQDRLVLERDVVKCLAGGPFDQAGLAKAMDAARASGWFETVTQVRRTDTDLVVVEGAWAAPFALVCDASGEHLVDTKGRLLPRSYAAGQGPKLLRIQGVTQPCPTAFGATWPGAEVGAALQMAVLIQARPWKSQVAAIDLTGYAREGIVRLRTDTGCEIVWGRAPGTETASEVPAVQKLAVLQYAYDHGGRIDAGAAHAIDLRGDFTVAR